MSEKITYLLREEALIIEAEGATGESVDLLIDAADEITTLRQQLAESQARVAELEGLIYRKCEHYILRKQAEAVKESAQEMLEEWPEFDVAHQWLIVRSESLAQQADEAERAGGER